RKIYSSLLSNSIHYSGFLDLAKFPNSIINIGGQINRIFKNKFCINANLKSISEKYPIEFAYALAFMHTESDKSILPPYINKTFPNTQKIIDHIRFKSCEEPA